MGVSLINIERMKQVYQRLTQYRGTSNLLFFAVGLTDAVLTNLLLLFSLSLSLFSFSFHLFGL